MVATSEKIKNMDKAQKISVSIPESVIAEVKALAESEQRSFSNMLAMLAKSGLEKRKAA
jgi:hypothetical protein